MKSREKRRNLAEEEMRKKEEFRKEMERRSYNRQVEEQK